MPYDAVRMANFGRDTARAYASFTRAEEKLCEEINSAIKEGVKPIKIAHDILGRCPNKAARVDLISIVVALTRMGKLPESVAEPFHDGIRPIRI